MKRIVIKFILTISLLLGIETHTYAEIWNKVQSGNYFSTIKNTEFGLVAGEFDQRSGNSSYNGIYISNDIGNTWNQNGLQGRGITDISSNSNFIYATTYNVLNSKTGLYKTADQGKTWAQLGPVFSASKVRALGSNIYLGSFSNGLWVSQNNGETWVQKIGSGWFGPNIISIEVLGSTVFVGTAGKTYISIDSGTTWNEINALSGKSIKYFTKQDNTLYAATQDNDGIYAANDNGNTWVKNLIFGTSPVYGLITYNNCIYAGKKFSSDNTNRIIKSCDKGNTWNTTGYTSAALTNQINQLTYFYATNGYIFASVQNEGVYRMEIINPSIEYFKFLETPFTVNNNRTNLDYISSYFDHNLPLLGYNYHKEPTNELKTTTSFLGETATEPGMYYSSHSGIDYALNYGTEIKAAADGKAYYYYCKDCGNTIKIDHLNGYQSTYMHLQKNNLVTATQPTVVLKGETIGKVGMTGNTSGPHLHFEVNKDVNNDNNFNNDFPMGRVDPYGWLNVFMNDPWLNYSWQDTLGIHTGTQSKYLWQNDIGEVSKIISPKNLLLPINIGNKTIDIKSISAPLPLNIIARPGTLPILSNVQKNLEYIKNTALSVQIVDTLGSVMHKFQGKIKFTFDLSQIPLDNVDPNTLSAYYYDDVLNKWVLQTSIWDSMQKKLTTETNHLTNFAVFANKQDIQPPETIVAVTGNISNGWYIEMPTITLNTGDITDKIFYSLEDDLWEEYTQPIKITNEGILYFRYRSMDVNNNLEETKQIMIKINTGKKLTKTVRIANTTYNTGLFNNTAP